MKTQIRDYVRVSTSIPPFSLGKSLIHFTSCFPGSADTSAPRPHPEEEKAISPAAPHSKKALNLPEEDS